MYHPTHNVINISAIQEHFRLCQNPSDRSSFRIPFPLILRPKIHFFALAAKILKEKRKANKGQPRVVGLKTN